MYSESTQGDQSQFVTPRETYKNIINGHGDKIARIRHTLLINNFTKKALEDMHKNEILLWRES